MSEQNRKSEMQASREFAIADAAESVDHLVDPKND